MAAIVPVRLGTHPLAPPGGHPARQRRRLDSEWLPHPLIDEPR